MTTSYSRHHILEVLPSFEGKPSIYIENMVICLAKITHIKATDDGISATAMTLSHPGLSTRENSWRIAVNWQYFSFKPTYWSAAYAGWRLFFDETVITQVLDIVSKLPPGQSYHDDYSIIPVPLGAHRKFKFVARRQGPIAQALYDYLEEQEMAILSAAE